jgi:hypothetical protein
MESDRTAGGFARLIAWTIRAADKLMRLPQTSIKKVATDMPNIVARLETVIFLRVC